MTKNRSTGHALLFIFAAFLILISNYILYRLPAIGPVPKQAAIGSLMDMFIILPAMFYFMVLRKRFQFKKIALSFLFAYMAARIIIPPVYLNDYPFIPYIIIGLEGMALFLEVWLIFSVARKLPAIYRETRLINKQLLLGQVSLRNAFEKHLPGSRTALIWATEFSLYYFAFFNWKKKATMSNVPAFTYHLKKSTIALYIMLIHAIIIETAGIHFLLHSWNQWVSYSLLFLNIYGILFFLAEANAISKSPFLILPDRLILQVGLSKGMEIPFNDIKHITLYNGPEKFTKAEEKCIFDARCPDFITEKPKIDIILYSPLTAKLIYGFKKTVTRIVLDVDNPSEFLNAMSNYLPSPKSN